MNDNVKIPTWVWALAVVCVGFVGASVFCGCGTGKTVCEVIDVAHHACEVLPIKYLGPDGKERTVLVPKRALVRTAEAERMAQQGSSDGGTDQ